MAYFWLTPGGDLGNIFGDENGKRSDEFKTYI